MLYPEKSSKLDFCHLCVDNCDSYERSNRVKTLEKMVKTIEKDGQSINLDGYIGDVIIGHDYRAISVYVRIPFISIQAAERLMNEIAKKGLVLNVGNNDCPSIGL